MKSLKKVYTPILFLLILVVLGACSAESDLLLDWSDQHISYEGRIDTSRTHGAELYWPGTSIKINFEGEAIEAMLEESRGENYYNVILDDELMFILRPDLAQGYHLLASELSPGPHTLELFKRTEWDRGKTSFYGFRIKGDAKVLPKSPEKKRKIEFYGNSITAGYAVEDNSGGDSPDSTYTNNYLSYAALIARHYNAQYHCTAKGGIGINISWFPLIMPEVYDRINPEDHESQWDFSRYQPDIVVINLMQNDSWLVHMPEHKEFVSRFGEESPDETTLINAYQLFVTNIRMHYPGARIICALGNMDATSKGSVWPDYVTRAVANLGDSAIYTHFVPYKETPGHPSISEQQDMANSFIRFIDENIEW